MDKVTSFYNKPYAFLNKREEPPKRKVEERIGDFREFEQFLSPEQLHLQVSRCMDCGIPYCHALGCPLLNRIPDFNSMVYSGHWERALEILHSTNNFPEITGRVCPAPCEKACTLEISGEPVIIRHIELQIAEWGWREGYVRPQINPNKTHKKVAIIGSGPSGLSCAQELARMGHTPVVFERQDRIGGLLRYGIPDFKLEKWILDRRIEQLKQEGVEFETEVDVGVDISARYLRRHFHAIFIAMGAGVPRDLDIPGRTLSGIHFALDYLTQQNRQVAGEAIPKEKQIHAFGKHVVVIGGGDTGSDCVGTARRQGAKTITQIEILPKPPLHRPLDNPWPTWPNVLRTSSSHEEGCERLWSVTPKAFLGQEGRVTGIQCVQVKWIEANGKKMCTEVPHSEFELPADLVLISAGFLHVEHGSLIRDLQLPIDARGNIVVNENGRTPILGIFAGGDAVQGPSLVVKAITEGRKVARGIHQYLFQ